MSDLACSDLDGATDVGDPRCYSSTPGEFAARWNGWSEERRAAFLRLMVQNAEIAERVRNILT